MGKGLIRERRTAFSPRNILATLDFLGLNDEEKRALLLKLKDELEKLRKKDP